MAILHEIFRNYVLFTHVKAFVKCIIIILGKETIMPLCDTRWRLSSHFNVSHLEVLTSASLMGAPFTVIVK